MSEIDTPYLVDPRPDTGLDNARLGMWLFLASEAMLFAGLFSAYVLLREGATDWPRHALNVPLGAFNTCVLVASSVSMVRAWSSLATSDWSKHRRYLSSAAGLALVFLAVKLFEYRQHLAAGEGPSTDTFLALYFTLTAVHAVHLLGGLIAVFYFLGPGAGLWKSRPRQYAHRIEITGMYWHFVDLIWLGLFSLLYLL